MLLWSLRALHVRLGGKATTDQAETNVALLARRMDNHSPLGGICEIIDRYHRSPLCDVGELLGVPLNLFAGVYSTTSEVDL